jgi:hypothetical protein
MRLVAVELSRFWLRRAVVLTLLLGAVLTALVALAAIWYTRPYSGAELADAQRQASSLNHQFQQDYQDCLDDPGSVTGDSGGQCVRERADASWFLDRTRLNLVDEVTTSGTTVALILAGVAVIVGATFAGADWASGSLATQLLFDPRRGRLWTAKAVAVVVGTLLTTAVVLGGFWAALLLTAALRDVPTPDDVVGTIWPVAGRGVVLATAAGLGSYALTMLFRHTVATLALLFTFAAVGELLAATLPVARISRWALSNNLVAWVQDGREVFDDSACRPGHECDPYYVLGLPHAAVYLAVLLVVAVGVSVLSFRRRDVG